MPCHLGPSWGFAGACWGFAGPHCAVAGAYWDLAGALQDLVGTLRGRTVPSLRRPGISLGRCEPSLRPRQGALGALKPRCGVLGACWGVGASLGPRGARWDLSGALLGCIRASLRRTWGLSGACCGLGVTHWDVAGACWHIAGDALKPRWGFPGARWCLAVSSGSAVAWLNVGMVFGLVEGEVGTLAPSRLC